MAEIELIQTRSVGLAGGIASGKTACGNFFCDLGIPVIDADIVAQKVIAPNTPGLKKLQQKIGNKYFISGNLDRYTLRNDLFVDNVLKKNVENVIHPLVKLEIDSWLATKKKSIYQIVISPLMFEFKKHISFDASILVWVTHEEQICRTIKRDNCSREHAEAIISSQMSTKEKLKLATFSINNSSSLTELKLKVLEMHKILVNSYGC
tara:strand:+ start:110 stop:730 length:621 start_codon:yes stop_codon:yes gene_type:complete